MLIVPRAIVEQSQSGFTCTAIFVGIVRTPGFGLQYRRANQRLRLSALTSHNKNAGAPRGAPCVLRECAQPFQLNHMCRIFGGCNPPNAAGTGSRSPRQPGASTGLVGCLRRSYMVVRCHTRHYIRALPSPRRFCPSSSNSSLAPLRYRFWLCVLV